MLLFRFSLLTLFALILSGCVTTNADQEPFFAELGQIQVEKVSGREGQIYRQELERLLDRSPESDSRYQLSTSINLTYPEDAVDMDVMISLYDQTIGQTVLQKSFVSSVSVGGVASLYGSEAAKNNARERLAVNSAQKVYRYLMLYFSRQEKPSS